MAKREKKEVSAELVIMVKTWLGKDGMNWWRKIQREHGRVDAIWFNKVPGSKRTIPHPVHFREGMSVRNFMRSTGLCEGWDSHDYDCNWKFLIEKAIA